MHDTTQQSTASKVTAGLYITATPIGNIKDLTLRALDVLKSVDVIACEDTRTTQKLLSHYGIHTKVIPYHDHSTEQTREHILRRIEQGESVALVSDAGTPLISDPGYKLVRMAQERNLAVTTLPGASSVLAALTLSGLPTNRFLFEGFLPPRQQARIKVLIPLKPLPATLVFFEAARRLTETLEDMLAVFGNREVAVVREITKFFEETRRAPLQELLPHYQQQGDPKGEVVIVVAPPEEQADENTLDDALAKALLTMSVKEAAQFVSAQTGLPKKQVYARALEMKEAGSG